MEEKSKVTIDTSEPCVLCDICPQTFPDCIDNRCHSYYTLKRLEAEKKA